MSFFTRYKYDPQTDILGSGGFAKVFKAWDSDLEMFVALKIFTSTNSGKYNLIHDFKKGIKLNHTNIIRYIQIESIEREDSFTGVYSGQSEPLNPVQSEPVIPVQSEPPLRV
jgi:serine/threonine protein kinase